jgi:NodT family efflux transporter outer membrane factor (OMF) lipoprotein
MSVPTSQRDQKGAASESRLTALRPPFSAAIAVFLAIVLCGCAVGPKYVRPSVPTPPAFKEQAAPGAAAATNWKPAQPSEAAARGKWWEAFNDPGLNALEDKATASNQTIAAAAANFFAARALVKEARSQYFPSVTTSPSYLNSRPSPAQFAGLNRAGSSGSTFSVRSYNAYTLPFDAAWEPDLWERIRSEVGTNTFAAQASAADLANVRLSVEAELAADYYALRGQDSLKELLDSTVAAYQQTLHLTQSLYRSGLVSDEAVAQAEAQLRVAEAQDTNAGILRAQYEHAIAVLVGEPASTFSLPERSLEIIPPKIPAGVPSQLLERRPDIAASERAVAQANAQIGVAKAAYFPNVFLGAVGGFGNSSFTSWLTWPSRFWSVGPSVAQTIFDAGLRRATVEQYRATYDQTVANYRQTVLTAFQQVEDNLASLRILSQSIQQQNAAVAAARRGFDEASSRYKAGLDPYLNVLTAQTLLLNNQQEVVNLRVQQAVASVQLIKALGGGWNTSLMPTPKDLRADSLSVSSGTRRSRR